MIRCALIFLVVISAPLVLSAQYKDSVDLAIEKDLINIRDWKETAETKWVTRLNGRLGELHYFGARHLDTPDDPQFALLEEAFKDLKPTVVLYEGPDRGEAISAQETIRKFGESGYVRWLGKGAGTRVMTLEPDFLKTYNYLVSKFDQRSVDIYMLSKEAMRLRTRKNLTVAETADQLRGMMAQVQRTTGRTLTVTDIEDLAAGFKQLTKSDIEWFNAPANWFDPNGDQNIITNKLSNVSSAYRNIFMVRLITELVNTGERVFAVVGRNHVPLQEKAISKRIIR